MTKTITNLTLGIPTYNRPKALIELLSNLYSKFDSEFQFEILVLDNSENIKTEEKLLECGFLNQKNLKYIRHKKNIGFDENILQLYLNTVTEYLWIIGDDDLPEEYCLNNILSSIVTKPDIVLIPFRQPSSLIIPIYQKNIFEVSHFNSIEACLLISKTGKITSYVLKKNHFDIESLERLKKFNQSGWMHMALAYEILYLNPNYVLKTLNIFGAKSKSDSDVKKLQWVPIAYLQFDLLRHHPFVKPLFSEKSIQKNWKNIYFGGIWLTCMGASRSWNVESGKEYEKFGKKYPFKKYLLTNPLFLSYWILIKLNLTKYFKAYFSFLSRRAGYL